MGKRFRRNPALAILANPASKPLASEVYEIAYKHADDGRAYKHAFHGGVRATLNGDGSVTLRHRGRKALWADYPDRPYLVNAPTKRNPMKRRKQTARKQHKRASARRRTASKRTPPAGFATWADYMKSIRPHSHKGGQMARKSKGRKHRASRARTRTRHHSTSSRRVVRRRYRHNPPAMRGIVGLVGRGIKDGLLVSAGEVGVRVIPSTVGLNMTGAAALGIEALVALGLGVLTGKIFSSDSGRMVLAGGFAAPMKALVKSFNLPVITPALSGYTAPVLDLGIGPTRAALPAHASSMSGYTYDAPALPVHMM